MNWVLALMRGVWQGSTQQRFKAIADLLGMIGPVLRNQDSGDTGIDDDLGRFCIAGAKIFGNLSQGNATKTVLAIDSAIEVLTALKEKFLAETGTVNNQV